MLYIYMKFRYTRNAIGTASNKIYDLRKLGVFHVCSLCIVNHHGLAKSLFNFQC